MRKLTKDDMVSLHACASMQFCGGSMPFWHGEYLRREKLRRWRLLQFFNRRNRRWNWNCYTVTERGQAEVEK